jgi:AcrR family transcriptional regulator
MSATPIRPRTEARRDQVLVAAAACFRINGFHNASMSQIARTAQMSPGHLYNLFESKEDIIRAIVARDQAQWLERVEALEHTSDVAQTMLEGVMAAVEKHTAQPCASLSIEVLAEASRNPGLAALVQATDTARRQRIEQLLKSVLASRGIALSPDALRGRAATLATLFDGLIIRTVRDPSMDKLGLAQSIRRLVKALLTP